MKNNYILLVLFLLFSGFMSAQSTEAFGEGTVSTAGPNSNGTVFNTSSSETHAHKYSGSAANNSYNNPNFTLTNFTTCQTSVTLAAHGSNWAGHTNTKYAIEVNGTTIANNLYGDYNVDLTPYIPVTSVKLRNDNYSQYWLAMHATVTINSPVASMPTTVPIVNDVVICSSQLPYNAQATLTQDGTTLKWYSNENGNNLTLNTKTITNSGIHNLWVSQANASGCESVRVPVTIKVNEVNATTSVTKSHCLTANGSIIVTPTVGTAPFTYLWQDGVTTKDRTNITFGDYSVTITDANNCSKVINTTVGMTIDMVVTEVSKTNVLCYGDNTGALTINVTGGTAPYTYQWPTNVVTGAGTNSISGLTAGNYNVVVTDANGCITNATFSITQNAAISGYVSSGSFNCFLTTNNLVTIEVYGGSGIYTYSWAPYGGTGKTATGLATGDYEVTVTDSNGCQGVVNVSVMNANLEGTVTTSQTNVSCNGGSNGTATITIDNQTEEGYYEYEWFPIGGYESTATNLPAGEYTVTVTNYDYYCQVIQHFTITEPEVLTATIAVVTNSQNNTTILQATPTGGTAPYTYLWNTGATTATLSSYELGTYSCTVTDVNGCVAALAEIEIVAPTAFEVTGGGTICAGGSGIAVGLAESETGVTYQVKFGGTNVGIPVAGTGDVLSLGSFSTEGTYTVVGTSIDTGLTTTMTGSASIIIANFPINIIVPTITCITTSVNLTAIIGSLFNFTDAFAPANWTLSNTNANGTVDTSSAPASIAITGGNNGSNSSGTTSYSITMPMSGTLSFDWYYKTNDDFPEYDYPQMVYNGVTSFLTGFNKFGNKTQSGSVTIEVTAGETFELRMYTEDNVSGNAMVAISNFSLELPFTGTPSYAWTASNGGVITGATDDYTANAISTGTYTLTVSIDGCTFSKEIVVDFESFDLDVTTWNGTVWSNGQPHIGVKAIIDGDLIVSIDLEACELVITENGSLTVQSGAYTGVIGKVTNNAAALDFVVENNGVLVQLKDVQNEGPVTVNVNSFPLYRQDYTLWSSPVKQQNLRSFSPQTIFNRFSSYNPSLGTVGEYVQEIFTTQDVLTKEFEAANGYLIRMPNNWAEYVDAGTAGVSYEGIFKGVPQNGTITVPLSTANVGMNLVGNPYPSPIIIPAFFGSNPNIEQTIYYWRKRNGAAGTGYATYNNMGFVTLQPGLSGVEDALDSEPYIGSGQGFFVKSTGATQLNFSNGMRNFQSNGVFLKQQNPQMNRFKLNLSNNTALVGQTLIGYTAAASAGVDNGYDSSYFNDSSTALTSLINGAEYIIQGLGLPFDVTSSVPLGFKTDVAGTYTISLGTFDGLFAENQDIYIKDNTTGLVHDVKDSSYSFVTEAGVFNSRFEVVYQNSVLGTDNPDLEINKILVYKEGQGIQINSMQVVMQKVELYDIRGSLLQVLDDVNESMATFSNLAIANQIVLVKITAVDGKVTTRKIVF